MSPSFSDLLMAYSFFYSNNWYRSVLPKNWHLCTLMAASACKICFRVAMSSLVPAHFPNQISMGRHLNIRKHAWRCGLDNAKKYNYDVRTVLLHTSCLLVSCLVIKWLPVACKLYPSATSRMQIVQIVPAWLPVACKLQPI